MGILSGQIQEKVRQLVDFVRRSVHSGVLCLLVCIWMHTRMHCVHAWLSLSSLTLYLICLSLRDRRVSERHTCLKKKKRKKKRIISFLTRLYLPRCCSVPRLSGEIWVSLDLLTLHAQAAEAWGLLWQMLSSGRLKWTLYVDMFCYLVRNIQK